MGFNYDNIMPQSTLEFAAYIAGVKNKSKLTIDGYMFDLYLFFTFIAKTKFNKKENPKTMLVDLRFIENEQLSQITFTDINMFIFSCKNERDNDVDARARKACAIRQYFKYISENRGYINENPAKLLQVAAPKRKLPKYLTLDESLELLKAAENNPRDYCMLTLFLNCGLRVSELVGLNISSINFEQQTIKVLGKGNKERIIYLNKSCILAITEYLKIRPVDNIPTMHKDALFISRLHKRIGIRAVQQLVEKYLLLAGLNPAEYSVHKLRHTAATLMYQHGGVDILVLKDMLGHENISTTEIYTHLSSEQLKEASKKNPLSGEFDPKE